MPTHISKREARRRDAEQFVKERFPSAEIIYKGYSSFLIVDQHPFLSILDKDPDKYYYSYDSLDPEHKSKVNVIGRVRYYRHTAWVSAKMELMKYESGKKDSPFMDRVMF